MTPETFNKIEERAQELVNNLEALHKQVGSYHGAKDELHAISAKLLGFIEATQKLSEESHRIIETINQIGSGKIFEALEGIKNNQKRNLFVLIGIAVLVIALQAVFFFLKR